MFWRTFQNITPNHVPMSRLPYSWIGYRPPPPVLPQSHLPVIFVAHLLPAQLALHDTHCMQEQVVQVPETGVLRRSNAGQPAGLLYGARGRTLYAGHSRHKLPPMNSHHIATAQSASGLSSNQALLKTIPHTPIPICCWTQHLLLAAIVAAGQGGVFVTVWRTTVGLAPSQTPSPRPPHR